MLISAALILICFSGVQSPMVPEELIWRLSSRRWKFDARSRRGAWVEMSGRSKPRDPYVYIAHDGISHLQEPVVTCDK